MKLTIGYIVVALYVLLVLLACWIMNKSGFEVKYTRKVGHISLSGLWPIQYYFFGISYHLIIPISICAIINIIAFKYKWFKGIEYCSSDNKQYGTIYFTVIMALSAIIQLFVPALFFPMGIAYFCLTIGDGFAAVVGLVCKKYNFILCNKKTLIGSSTMLISCFVVSAIFTSVYDIELSVIELISIASFACLVELYTPFGIDNITIPVCVTLWVYLIILGCISMSVLVIVAVSPVLHFIILNRKFFSIPASVLSFIYLVTLAACLGWLAVVLIMFPFIINTIIIIIRKRYFTHISTLHFGEIKGRKCIQIICNGVVSLIAAVFFCMFGKNIGMYIAIACIAEAFGDSMASDIGELSNKEPFDICTMKKVTTGLSGGVTLLGSTSGILSAAFVIVISTIFINISITRCLLIILSAVLGIFIDSVLGSKLQVKYRCQICYSLTESKVHCSKETVLSSGIKFVDNSLVNLFSNISTGVICFILLIIVQ